MNVSAQPSTSSAVVAVDRHAPRLVTLGDLVPVETGRLASGRQVLADVLREIARCQPSLAE